MAVWAQDVTAGAGVSVGAVPNVLNQSERASARTIERVQQVRLVPACPET
jgi:LacI family transcriptional regulator